MNAYVTVLLAVMALAAGMGLNTAKAGDRHGKMSAASTTAVCLERGGRLVGIDTGCTSGMVEPELVVTQGLSAVRNEVGLVPAQSSTGRAGSVGFGVERTR